MKPGLYVRNPHLSVEEHGQRLHIRMPYFGSKVECNALVRTLLNRFSIPRPLDDMLQANVGDDVVDFLVHHFLLLPEAEKDFLARGLLVRANDAIGLDTSWFELHSSAQPGDAAFFHAPMAFSRGRSVATGGHLVRDALGVLRNDPASEVLDFEIRRKTQLSRLRLRDLGDVVIDAGHDTMETTGLRIRKIVRGVLDRGLFPITVGGDHAVTFFILDEIMNSYKRIGIIQFDAHSDFQILPDASCNDLTHANVFGHLIRRPELKVLLQLGLRDLFCTPSGTRKIQDKRVRFISSRDLRRTPPSKVFARLRRDIPYYLSFDVDALDPAVAPETGYPLPGGLHYYQALELISYAASNFQLIGADVVEIGESRGTCNAAAEVAGRLVLTVLMSRTETQPLGAYVFDGRESR